MVYTIDFNIKRKDTLEFSLNVTDEKDQIMDLTGFTSRCIIVSKLGQETADAETAGSIIAVEGKITYNFSITDMDLEPKKYFLGVILESNDLNFRQTIKEGYLTVMQGYL